MFSAELDRKYLVMWDGVLPSMFSVKLAGECECSPGVFYVNLRFLTTPLGPRPLKHSCVSKIRVSQRQ